jgi:diphthamide biosynthesis methyltransferase
MTTKVKIEIVEKHIPVLVETMSIIGTVDNTITLNEISENCEIYLHTYQFLRIREKKEDGRVK